MNIHHLEIFYYVARYGGIVEGARNIPYGIQQPAVSGQMLVLEGSLGVTLFQRRPFALTSQGEKLYRFVEPFFANVDAMEEEICGGATQQLRVGASEIVLREHLPAVMQSVRRQFPKLKLVLREGDQHQLERLLEKGEIDVALTLIEKKPSSSINSLSLMELPLVLLVNKKSRLVSATDLWKQDRIAETLLCLPPADVICKNFQAGLTRLGVDWFPGIELSALQIIEAYVEQDFGIGLSVAIPEGKLPKGVRALPLDGFKPVNFGVLWQRRPTALVTAFIEQIQAVRAAKFKM